MEELLEDACRGDHFCSDMRMALDHLQCIHALGGGGGRGTEHEDSHPSGTINKLDRKYT